MKKIIIGLLTLSFILAFVSGCDDDDNPVTSEVENIVWTIVSDTYASCTDPNSDGTTTFACTSNDCVTLFFSGGVLTWTEIVSGVTTTETGSYTITGNTLTVSDPGGGSSVFTFTVSGNTLTLVGPGGDPGCIESLVLTK